MIDIEKMKQLTGFAEACYDTNSVEELSAALKQRAADKTDCETWKITPTQWRAAIAEALAAKLEDAGGIPGGVKRGERK